MEAKSIWIENENKADTYAEFIGICEVDEGRKVNIKIACDGHFVVYVNERLAYFGAAADYTWHKMYHKKDITKYCSRQNTIRIMVWYPGIDSQTYIKGDAGLSFVIEQEGKVLLESSSHILGRKCLNYRNGYCKTITSQLGLSYFFDNTLDNQEIFRQSIEQKATKKYYLRKTGNLQLGKRVFSHCIESASGYLIDFGEEIVGFLELDFISSEEQNLLISYGEHLVDGKVPRKIGERDFSVEFRAKRGENKYLNPFRRLAGRYLQVDCEHPLEVSYIGIRPTDRRVKSIKRDFQDAMLQKIYDVSVNTLKKCMHEHYEDCPWREQAMYTLDSRNQMLCGYYAFQGYRYQRENLLFIAKGQRTDGLLSLCFPAGIDIPIPFFSLVYVMQVAEYVQYTGDKSILKHVKPVINKILETFREKIDDTGLIANFSYPYWNFYEWSKASNNEHETKRGPEEQHTKQYDLILNCMYVYACKIYETIFDSYDGGKDVISRIHDVFYNQKTGLYKLSTNGEDYSQLGNSFAILIGLGEKKLAEKIINDKNLIPVTLSMHTFFYDALLSISKEYIPFVLEDIKKKYGRMLENGATTFWETAEGWQDFGGAGSLCHGWSAIPAYYLPLLLKK